MTDLTYYKHLYLLENKRDAIYIGYRITFTKSEYAILNVLIQNTKKPISAEKIALLSGLNCKKENIVFHISRINSKARAIGNRDLIKNSPKIGYFLNKEM